jgi:hypothetical protein
MKTRNKIFQNFIQTNYIQKYHFVTSETEKTFLSQRKTGETFCITAPRFKLRVIKRLVDQMRRWTECLYQVRKSQPAHFSVYQTVENTYHGPTYIHSQQEEILLEEKIKLTPRGAPQIDLFANVRMLYANKVAAIIAGDFRMADTSQVIIKTF